MPERVMVIVYGTLCRLNISDVDRQPAVEQFGKCNLMSREGAMMMFFDVFNLKNFCLGLIGKIRNSLTFPILPGDYINVRPPPVTG